MWDTRYAAGFGGRETRRWLYLKRFDRNTGYSKVNFANEVRGVGVVDEGGERMVRWRSDGRARVVGL